MNIPLLIFIYSLDIYCIVLDYITLH